MEESPNQLKNPDTNYFLDHLNDELNKGSSEESFNVLKEQELPSLLEQDLLPPVKDGVDLDLDAQEEAVLAGLQQNKEVSQVPNQPSRRPRVHMFPYVLQNKPAQSAEAVPKEPKFETVEDAILNKLNNSDGLFKDEVVSLILGLRESGDIAHDEPITRSSVGRTVLSLIDRKILVSDKEGKLRVVKVAGGSTHVSGDTEQESVQQEEIISAEASPLEKNIEKITLDVGVSTVASDRHPQHNEDKFLQEKERKVFAVFDGMGGAEGGERASTLALQYVQGEVSRIPNDASVGEVEQTLRSILEHANKAVFNDPFQNGKDVSERMGTTATLVKVIEDAQGEKIVVASVGDSRVYVHHINGTLEQVTIDANRAHFEMRSEGKTEDEIRAFQKKTNNATSLSAFDNSNPAQRMAEMMRYNQRNEISSALGVFEETQVDTYVRNLENGDIVLVTSDGVHDNLTDDEIRDCIKEGVTQGLTAHEISNVLIEKALERSREKDPNNPQQKHFRAKSDDITALVVCVGGADNTQGHNAETPTFDGEIISGELPYPEGFVPEPPPIVEPVLVKPIGNTLFPPQTPRKASSSIQTKPSIVNHQHITVEDLNRRAAEAQNVAVEKLAAEKTDEEKENLIGKANSFDELYEALRECKVIKGSDGTNFTADDLVSKIEEARNSRGFNFLITRITRSCGLRDKVSELGQVENVSGVAQNIQVEPSPVVVPDAPHVELKEGQVDARALVNQAENLDQLCDAVETICQTEGDIQDGGRVLNAEQIVNVIRSGGESVDLDLPVAYGIRAKYRELLRPKSGDASVAEEEKEVDTSPVAHTSEAQTITDLYDEPIGPVSKEESEKIEREMRERLADAREKFAAQESAYKTKVREGKKMFRSIMEKLGAPGKQRPALEREVEHIEAEKAYMEAKWNLKNFISGRNIKEVPFSHAGSILGQHEGGNKRVDVGVFEQAEKEYKLLQDRLREMTPEKERSTIEKAFQKWNSYPLKYRVAFSAALLTAGGVAIGAVGVSGALAAFGLRAGRAFIGTNIGLAAGRMYGNAKAEEVKENRTEFLEEYGSKNTLDKDAFIEAEKELELAFEKEKSEIKKNQIKKGLVTAAVAGVSTIGIGMVGQAIAGESVPSGAKVSGNIDSAPKPKIAVDANTTSTKSWFDKIFKDNEGPVTKPSVATAEGSPQKVDVPFEIKGYEPVGVNLSSKGFIDTVTQLKTNLQGHSVSPAVEKLLSQSPEKIAMDLGLYKPGQAAESAFGLQGEQLTMNINGDITLMHNDGSVNILFDASGKAHQFGEYAGNTMFDADHSDTSPLPKDVPSVKASTTAEALAKSTSATPEVGISSRSPLASVVMDTGTVGLSSAETPTPKVINFEQIVAPSAEYTGPQDMVTGKLPLKPEYQFDPKFKAERTAYNVRLEKELMNIPQDMFDLRYPIEYNGGRINVFQKGDNITILLNGQQIGTGKIIDGQPGLQYEASLGKGMLGVKSDFEQAFEKAREGVEKNKMFFKVKQ